MLVHRPDLPQELDNLVLKLMAKSPAARYQSAGEMLADLAKLRDLFHVGAAPTLLDDGIAGRDESQASSRAAGDGNRRDGSDHGAGREIDVLARGERQPDGVGKPSAALGGSDRGDHVGRRPSRRDRRMDISKPGRHGGSI